MHFLVLDDSGTIRQLVKYTLQTQKHWQVSLSENVIEAIEKCKQPDQTALFDLFIVDYLLEKETGFDFIKRIRRKPEYANTPIIMLSGETAYGFKQQIEDFKINTWLAKPIMPAELIEQIFKIYPSDPSGNHAP